MKSHCLKLFLLLSFSHYFYHSSKSRKLTTRLSFSFFHSMQWIPDNRWEYVCGRGHVNFLAIMTCSFSFESEVETEKYIALLYLKIKNSVYCSVSFLKHSYHKTIICFYSSLLLKNLASQFLHVSLKMLVAPVNCPSAY